MPTSETTLPLRIGARTLWTLRRRLVRRGLTLEEALAERLPALPPLGADEDGYLVSSLPAALAPRLAAQNKGLKPFVRQRYARSFTRLDLGFDRYLAGFSSKSRSTLKRKARKLADRSGGTLDLRCYRNAEEFERFYADARALSVRTYQEQLLDAGLPDGPEAYQEMLTLARRDQLRAWLLFVDGRPVSYLCAPAEGDTLIYAYLGYDPQFAEYSPGTVLQLEAMRQLMEQKRFRLFDFTEGQGQHKRLFATDGVACIDLLLMRPTVANLLAGYGLNGFDTAVGLAKKVLGGTGLGRRFRR
jgi:CelD/BcsL family acetyltransferase involved in cellulose biosynthesis